MTDATPYDVDVILASDLRLPGGTTSSVAEEVRAQSDAGISTALIHIVGSVTNYALPWSQHIRRVVGLPHVRLATPHSKLHARLLILRHPTVVFSTRSRMENITADHVIIVANHAAIDSGGTQHYDVKATDAKVRELFGVDPIWAPIGPVVRGTMLQQTTEVPFRDEDWVNIFSLPIQDEPRTGFLGSRPVIGRHSRPQPGKWPSTGRDILAAYPDSTQYDVRVLGGAQVAEKLVGYVPENWEVIPFGGEDPAVFLQGIDFWVYMHHPDLKEAFGRAAMEALAAGCVAIMPPYMEELFGDSALYAKPREVQGIIDEYYGDLDKFLAQSRRAQEFARSFSPEMHLRRLAELGVKPREAENEAQPTHGAENPGNPSGPTLALVDGDAHDERVSAYVTALERNPLLHVAVVASSPPSALNGHEVSYLPSAARLNMDAADWEGYLGHRMRRLMDSLDVETAVYDGVLPPTSVIESLAERPVAKVWVQRPLAAESDQSVLQSARLEAERHFPTVTTDPSIIIGGAS
ncbi:MAG: glycosyltransferase [Micrococcaceae bacterium]